MHSNTKNKISDISEILFGSYIEEINSKDTDDKMIISILNKVERRHNTILYLLNNRVLSLKSDKDELDNILKPIVYEYNHAVVNPKCQQTIGFRYRYSFSPHLLRKYPFDSWLFLNSTLGRLSFIKYWNHYTSHPNFWLNISMKRVFGFQLKEYQNLYSKLYYLSSNKI